MRRLTMLLLLALGLSAACVDISDALEEPAPGGSGGEPGGGGGSGGEGGGGAGGSLCPDGAGKLAQALRLDGSSWAVAVAGQHAVEPPGTRDWLNNFYAEAWILLPSVAGRHPVMGTRRSSDGRGWDLVIADGVPIFRLAVQGEAEPLKEIPAGPEVGPPLALVEPGSWTHVGVSAKVFGDQLHALVFVHGFSVADRAVSSRNDALLGASGQGLWIGGEPDGAECCFSGWIDEVKVQSGDLLDMPFRNHLFDRKPLTASSVRAAFRFGDTGAVACDSADRPHHARVLRRDADGTARPAEDAWDGETPTPLTVEPTPAPAPGCTGPGWQLGPEVWACELPEGDRTALDDLRAGVADWPAPCGQSHVLCTDADRPTLLGLDPTAWALLPGCFAVAASGESCSACDAAGADQSTAAVGLGCRTHQRREGEAGCFTGGLFTTGASLAAEVDPPGACLWRDHLTGVLCCLR